MRDMYGASFPARDALYWRGVAGAVERNDVKEVSKGPHISF